MVDQIAIETNREARQYVPDVKCPAPGCGAEVKLEARTYSFYNGPIICVTCKAQFRVRIGDRAHIAMPIDGILTPTGETYLTDKPLAGSDGGILLEPPVLISSDRTMPPILLQGIRAVSIPDNARFHMETAVRQFENGEYGQVPIPCRAAIQEALRHSGAGGTTISAMIESAIEQGILKGIAGRCCKVVAKAGGDAAHTTEGLQANWEALTIVGATLIVLGWLYAV